MTERLSPRFLRPRLRQGQSVFRCAAVLGTLLLFPGEGGQETSVFRDREVPLLASSPASRVLHNPSKRSRAPSRPVPSAWRCLLLRFASERHRSGAPAARHCHQPAHCSRAQCQRLFSLVPLISPSAAEARESLKNASQPAAAGAAWLSWKGDCARVPAVPHSCSLSSPWARARGDPHQKQALGAVLGRSLCSRVLPAAQRVARASVELSAPVGLWAGVSDKGPFIPKLRRSTSVNSCGKFCLQQSFINTHYGVVGAEGERKPLHRAAPRRACPPCSLRRQGRGVGWPGGSASGAASGQPALNPELRSSVQR